MSLLLGSAILLCGLASPPRSVLLRQRLQQPRVALPVRCSAPAAEVPAVDLVGDGGVLKQVVRPGDGSAPARCGECKGDERSSAASLASSSSGDGSTRSPLAMAAICAAFTRIACAILGAVTIVPFKVLGDMGGRCV